MRRPLSAVTLAQFNPIMSQPMPFKNAALPWGYRRGHCQ